MQRLGRASFDARLPGRVRAFVAAVGLPLLATVIASNLDVGTFGPPSLYLLAVVATAAVGGMWSGLAAAAISFVGLNYFFTEPVHTLRVGKLEDLVALLVFLVVAGIVGALFARELSERERAERQEAEMRLINRFSTRLLSAELDGSVVRDFAGMLVGQLGLARCSIEIVGEPSLSASMPERAQAAAGPALEVPITMGVARLGLLRVERAGDGRPYTDAEYRLLMALASQAALAVERRRLDAEARAARTDAEISEIRAALFSSVTHDLRTPLASIKAGITSLMDEGVAYAPEARRELFTTVLEETERLGRLVDNLLNLARARAGDIAIEKELTPFEDVVETVLARLRGALAPFSLRTTVRGDPPGIWVDPVKMDQALTNIVENAARHSPPGGEIQVSVTPWHGGIQVRVADRGPGIPESERVLVFEPFYRARGTVGPGSGLGLAIARAVVQAHDGRIWIEGTPGGGTAVLIELPVGEPVDAKASP